MASDAPVRPLSRDLLLGSWRMTSWITRDVATGERQDALGQNPRGTVVYTPERVTFLIVKNNRASPEQLPPSDEEKIALRHDVRLFWRLYGRVRSGRASRRPELE
jgi:hypothetical protein